MTVNLTDGCQSGAVRNALAARGGALLSLPDVPEGGPERRLRALAPVRLKDFRWTRGTPAKFDSSSLAYRHYCSDCGTPLTFGYHHKDWIDMTNGSLEKPGEVPPMKQYGLESRISWYCLAVIDQLPAQDTNVTIDGHSQTVISYQHPRTRDTAGLAPQAPLVKEVEPPSICATSPRIDRGPPALNAEHFKSVIPGYPDQSRVGRIS